MKEKVNSYRRYSTLGVHTLAWTLLGFLQLFYIPLSWNIAVPTFFWIWHCCVLFMMIAVFYLNAVVIVPKTIILHKTSSFILWVAACLIFTQIVAFFYTDYTNLREQMSVIKGKNVRYNRWFDNFVFTETMLVLALSTGWAMLSHWQRAIQREKNLAQDKMMTELALLKIQINPHFFFNSLNSVYALTYIEVESARIALLTLSRMMRHLLYTQDEVTTLSKEIAFLKDYISIMSLRSGKKITIDFQVPDQIQDRAIAPMMLLPFIENAFKHGVDATGFGRIQIALLQEDAYIRLSVINDVFDVIESDLRAGGGVGLENTKRRLQLIYPDRYQLDLGVNDVGRYEVLLQLNLIE